MKDNPKKRQNGILNCKGKQGITLVALIITVIVLIVLGGTATSVAIDHFNTIRQKGFYTKLELAQEAVEKIRNTNENYTDKNGNKVYIKQAGSTASGYEDLIAQLGYSSSNFRYFTKEEVESILGISGVNLNLLIDFDNAIVINPEGITITENGKTTTYHMLEKRNKYTESKNTTKNQGEIDFTCSVAAYSSTSYKVTITPINRGDITKGVVEYKVETDNYWETAKDNEFLIPSLGEYYVRYTDANNNFKEKKLNITFNTDTNKFVITEEQ